MSDHRTHRPGAGTAWGRPAGETTCRCEELNPDPSCAPDDRTVCVHCARDMAATGGADILAVLTTYSTGDAPGPETPDELRLRGADAQRWVVTTADAYRRSLAGILAARIDDARIVEFSVYSGWEPDGYWTVASQQNPRTGQWEERTVALSGVTDHVHHLVWVLLSEIDHGGGTARPPGRRS